LDRVIEDALKASHLKPGNKDYHHIAGLAFEMKGELEASLQCFEVVDEPPLCPLLCLIKSNGGIRSTS
jgi:hypothetical protein